MEIQWLDERNRLSTNRVEDILQCLENYNLSCCELYDFLIKNKALLKQAKSSQKFERKQ